MKNLHVLVFRMDRRNDRDINPVCVGFPHCVPPGKIYTRCACVGWMNKFPGCAVVSVFWLWQKIVFGFTSILRVKYKMGCRNRYSEGRNNRQMTPRGYPNFNSYVKNLRVLVFWTDGDINPVWASLTTFLQVKILL
jgi:hypothetical protein